MIILNVTKKQGFAISLEDTFLEKPHGGLLYDNNRTVLWKLFVIV